MLSKVWAGLACLQAVMLLPLFGQSDLATVTGVVTDSAQAVMPGVTITIRNTDTNEPRAISTNAEGIYTITSLPPGPYILIAERTGFHIYKQTGIVLATGQALRTDIKMEVGSVSETVSVQAEVAPLNTENGAVKGDVVVHAEIQDMPLNGRDFTELALLVPGVVPKAQGGGGSFASVNGARADNTNFRVDGFDDRNIRGAAAQLRPNLDALEEFKMETTGYSAEYGKMAGGILNMTLRSGTNQYHGSVFEYFRNNIFDARAFFDADNLGLHQNQWGGTLAGPLAIPKVYNGHDRTFFLLSEESYRLSWFQTKLATVPTLLQRDGNFSQTVSNAGKPITLKNPFAAYAPFPGNIIPANLFNPVALKLLQYYPLPNRAGAGNNLSAVADNVDFWDSVLGKVDHRFSEKDSLSFRYAKRWGRSNDPFVEPLGTFDKAIRDDRSLGGFSHTHMFNPGLLTEIRVGFSRNATREKNKDAGQPSAAQLGMHGSSSDPLLAGFPLINVTNYSALGYPANEPVQYYVTNWQFGDKFTWVKAKHVLKWGIDYNRYQINQPYFNNSRGTMTANGNWTGNGTAANGNAVGDLLLGLLNSSSLNTLTARNYMREESTNLFLNDDFKVTRSLTLNLGLRYELNTPAYDKYDRMTNFIPSLGKIVIASTNGVPNYQQLLQQTGLGSTMSLAKDDNLPRGLVHTFYKGIAPRFGFAWRPFDSRTTVLRGGYGIFYAGQLLNNVRNGLDNTFPYVLAVSCARVAADPSHITLDNPWTTDPLTCGYSGTTSASGFDVRPTSGYLQSYNLTVERDLGKGNVIEVGYVGSKGTHLSRYYNVNQPYRTIANYQATGTFPSPFPQLGTITYWDMQANSIYNAGQVIFRKRAAGGIFYRFSYQYSKSIDYASQESGASDGGYAQAIDPRNLALERARADWDRGHTFTANFSYALPFGRGKTFFHNSRLENAIAGGWQLSGTAAYYTGAPFTIEDSAANTAIGESNRPNRIANGRETSGIGRRGVDFPWYDPSAFVATPGCASRTDCSPDAYGFLPFVPGNSGRGILDGPGTQNINLSLFKNIPLGERKRVQFRWETFNIFNHPNFQLPNRNFNETAAGYVNDVAAKGQGGPRTMQFALRYEF